MEKTTRKSRKKTAGTSSGGSNFIIQGSILAIAAIIVRLIGMLYRIPVAEKIGDEGMGYYSSAYSVYSILLIMSSYSLPVAVSKMVASRLANHQYRNTERILRASLFYATIAGAIGAGVLWFGADFFAEAIKMPYSSYALRTLAPTIWIMAYLGVLRGYFQGHSTMVPTAVSQIFEQIVNAVISIVAAGSLFELGTASNLVYESTEYSYAFGAAGGTIGTGAGAFTALLFFMLLMGLYRPAVRRKIRRDQTAEQESYGKISYVLCITIIPIIISSVIYNISSLIDTYLFGNAMDMFGRSDEIAASWCVYMGKYHLLFNIPVGIANALASSLIPSLSRATAEHNRKQVLIRISSAVRFSMIIAIPSAIGLAVLAKPISDLLFWGADNETLAAMTRAGSLAVVFFSLSTVTNAVLQGINRMHVPIRNSAIALVLHVIILAVMLFGMKAGIYSVVYTNILFALFVCLLNARSIARYLRYRQEIRRTFLIPTAASLGMGAVAYGAYQLCSKLFAELLSARVNNMLSTLLAIALAAAVYFVLLLKMRCVSDQELREMPMGMRILRLARKLHIM